MSTFNRFRVAASHLILSLVLLGMIIPGCASTPADENGSSSGYQHGNLYRDDVHSVRIPIFENRTLTTGIEREITDALIKEIQTRTPYFVTSGDSADTELTGTIVEVTKTRLNRARGSGLVREMIISVTVDYQWRDTRSGKVYVARRNFQAGDEYIPSMPVSEQQEIAHFGVAQNLSRAIVDTLRDQW